MNQQQPKTVKCSMDLLTKMVNTIQTMPYNQVSGLMAEIQQGFSNADPVPTQTAAKDPESDEVTD